MTNNILILFNPSSAGGKSLQQKQRVEALLVDRGIAYDLIVTESEAHLKTCASDGIGRYGVIVGAGGDTTFNLIANEMMRKPSDTALGIIGLGSVNDVALQFGVGTLEKAVDAIGAGIHKKTDLGLIEGGDVPPFYFLGTASLGLGPVVTQYVDAWMDRHRLLKRWRSSAQVWAGFMGTYRAFRRGEVPRTFEIQSEKIHESVTTPFMVFNNTAYAAGGLKPSATADPHDGKLDCTFVDSSSFGTLFRTMTELKKGGRSANVTSVQGERFDVKASEPFMIQVDGDILYSGRVAKLSCVADVLNVVVDTG